MAYLVSQIRKTNTGQYTYMMPITALQPGESEIDNILQASQINTPNIFGDSSLEGRFFQDFAIKGVFKKGVVYYLRFQVRRIPQYFYSGSVKGRVSHYQFDADNLNLQIILKNEGQDDEENIPPQIIGTCNVPTSYRNDNNNPEFSSYSFVFTPSKTFNRLGFRIGRVSFDAIQRKDFNNPRNWLLDNTEIISPGYKRDDDNIGESITISGPRIIWTDGSQQGQLRADLCVLKNLVTEKGGWLKFGYQSRPGSLIIVNGEPIRVGRSGIYEINNGTIIQSFMVASPGGWDNSKIDAFLLDYAYKS